jgi:uncharacterized protein YvpB
MAGKNDGKLILLYSIVLAMFVLLLIAIPGVISAPTAPLLGISLASTPTATIPPFTLRRSPFPSQLPEIPSHGLPGSSFPGNTNDLAAMITTTITATYTPTHSPTPQATSFSLLPFLYQVDVIATTMPSPMETVLFCDSLSQPVYIPDNDPAGVNDTIFIDDSRIVVDLSLYLDITHSSVGDLVLKLTNQAINKTITLVNRPGNPPGTCYENDVIAILDDYAARSVNEKCAPEFPSISGIYLASEYFHVFSKMLPSGTWRLNLADHASIDSGRLNHWCLIATLANLMPSPTPTPTPVVLPQSAYVSGMSGQSQYFNLDCESRSAVDWAKHFGKYIDELEFYYNLPQSFDDPEAGFVGNPTGTWGNIPPDDYGVHAPPVADLLRDYGLPATSYRSLKWDDIRSEIASGNPVIVWIIGDYSSNLADGIPHLYIPPSTGNTTIVAPYEHTVIVVGYSPTEVTVLNGSRFISIPLEQFLDSWSVLQFMGILARP